MSSLRCRLLQYAVIIGINGWHGSNIFFSIFSISCYGISPKTINRQSLRQSLQEKDSKNTCKKNIQSRSTEVFHEYLLEKGIAEPTEKSEIARVLKRF